MAQFVLLATNEILALWFSCKRWDPVATRGSGSIPSSVMFTLIILESFLETHYIITSPGAGFV
jgi:hypothetical protein